VAESEQLLFVCVCVSAGSLASMPSLPATMGLWLLQVWWLATPWLPWQQESWSSTHLSTHGATVAYSVP